MDVSSKDGGAKPRWRVGVVVVAPLARAPALLGACADESGSGARATTTTTTATTPTTAASGSTSLCAIFDRLVAGGAGPGAQFEATTPAGWQQRIETTAEIVDAAPPDWRDEAETYLQMVKDRAQLAAEHGYVGVQDLPADVRDDFISSHRSMQAQVNQLIAHMSSVCRTASSG
jgi:hypothetical protein